MTATWDCIEKQFTDLLDIQFWLMGRDVEHPAGNLLVELGLTRERPADPELPSRYTMVGHSELAIIWRCGLLLSSAHGDVLCIRGLAPRRVTYRSTHEMWDPRLVRAAHGHGGPYQPRHLADVSAWFARYELAVRAVAGMDHRTAPSGSVATLASHQRSCLARSWASLARLASSPALSPAAPTTQPARHETRPVHSSVGWTT